MAIKKLTSLSGYLNQYCNEAKKSTVSKIDDMNQWIKVLGNAGFTEKKENPYQPAEMEVGIVTGRKDYGLVFRCGSKCYWVEFDKLSLEYTGMLVGTAGDLCGHWRPLGESSAKLDTALQEINAYLSSI